MIKGPRYLRRSGDSSSSDGGGAPPIDYSSANPDAGALVPYRRRSSDADEYHEDVDAPLSSTADDGTKSLNVTGLRDRRLYLLFLWLFILLLLTIILIITNVMLIRVLQMSPHGMKALRIHNYVDERSGQKQSIVHFLASKINLGHIIARSGKVMGSRDRKLTIQGPAILVSTGQNDTRMTLRDGMCRLENTDKFQVVHSVTGKVMFSANHPLVNIDRRIKQLAAKRMITSKIRAPINENLHIASGNISLRGNEAIHLDAKTLNATAKTSIVLKTSKDGAIRFNSRRLFVGTSWKPLQVSSSPALTASVDAFRVCVCMSNTRPKLFIVNGNKPCNAEPTICP